MVSHDPVYGTFDEIQESNRRRAIWTLDDDAYAAMISDREDSLEGWD